MGYWDEYTSETVDTTPTTAELPYAPKERGFLGDTASSLGRGVLGLAGLAGSAYETLTGAETSLDEWAEETRKNTDFFKPDVSEYMGKQRFIKKGWQTAMESLVPSVGAAAPGIIPGAGFGSFFGPVGTLGGGIVGGMLSTLGLFGAGTYGQAKEEALAQGMDEESAHDYAFKKGLIEGGIETAATGVELATAGIGKLFTRPITQTLKAITSMSAKDVAKAYGRTIATEVSTEMLQAGLGAQVDISAGMGGTPISEAVVESILPAVFMSGIFVTGAQGYNIKQKAQLKSALESKNPAVRKKAGEVLYQNVLKEDPELAQQWKDHMEQYGDRPLNLNMTLTEIFQEAKNNEIEKTLTPDGKVNPLAPIDSLTSIVNMKLKATEDLGLDEDIEISPEAERQFKEAAAREVKLGNLKIQQEEATRMNELRTEQMDIAKAEKYVKERNKPKATAKATEEESEGEYDDAINEVIRNFQDSEQQNTRKRIAKETAKAKGLTAEETVVLESAMTKDVYGVPLNQEEIAVLEKTKSKLPGQEVPITSEDQQQAYVSEAEDTAVAEEDEVLKAAIRAARLPTGEVAGGEVAGEVVDTAASPEELLEKAEEGTLEPIATTIKEPMGEVAELFATNDAAGIKTIVNRLKKERKGSGQGAAAIFNELEAQARQEAERVGRVVEVEEGLQELRDDVTGKASSRKDSKFTLGWQQDSADMWSATTPEGKSFVVNVPKGRKQSLMYKESPEAEWKTVTGRGKIKLQQMAEDFVTKGIVPEGSTDVTEEAIDFTFSDINEDGELIPDIQGTAVLRQPELLSKVVRERMDNGQRSTDAYTIAKELFTNARNPLAKKVSGLLLKTSMKDKLKGIKIKHVSQTDKTLGGKSFYDPNVNTIYYSDNASERTLAHEIVHGVTVAELDVLGRDHRITQNLMSVAKAYKDWLLEGQEITPTIEYAFKDPKEFLAVTMTDPSVQADLKRIKVPKSERTRLIKTLWDKLINGIRNVFGLPTEYNSALEEIIGITSDLSSLNVAQEVAKRDPIAAEYMASGLNYFEAKRLSADLSGDYSPLTQESIKKSQEWIAKAKEAEAQDKQWFLEPLKKAFKSIDKYLTPVSDVVKEVSPIVHSKLIKMEADINLKNKAAHDSIQSFGQKYSKLPKETQEVLDLYLLNSNNPKDSKVLDEILREHGMTEDFAKVRKVLDDIYSRYDQVGLNVFNRIDKYFPRKVKDVKGLMAYLRVNQAKKEGRDIAGGTGVFDEILEDTKLSEKEKEDAIAQVVNTGYNPATALKIPSSTKSRSIQKVKADMMKFYQKPMDALIDTIYEANEAIETRKFIGSVGRQKAVKKLNAKYEQLQETIDPGKRQQLMIEVEALASKVADVDKISDESISSFLQKEGSSLTPEEQSDLTNALRSRLNQKGMSGVTARVRDLGLITALGSPLNAITQLGDLVWSLYENGPVNTIQAIFGNKEVTTKDLDMSHVLKEFSQGSTAQWVDKTLKWTAFSFMDQFGKNVNMQAAINKARKTSKEEFLSKWSDQLTSEVADKVWEDIQAGETTDDVRHFVFSSVSKFQPVSLSEMPQKYLESGNGRIFYTLKSYGIKALSNIRREIITEFRKGNTKVAGKNLMTLMPLLVLANASVDELKDFILGRDDAFSDQVWDNLLKLGFASRYTVDKGMRSGQLVSTFFKDVLAPPGLGVADPFLKDLYNLVSEDKQVTYKSLNSLPFVGKLAYSRTPEGKAKESDKQRLQLYAEIRQSVSDGNYNTVRQKINKYNKEQRKIGGKIIDNKTIRTLKSKERKKLNSR